MEDKDKQLLKMIRKHPEDCDSVVAEIVAEVSGEEKFKGIYLSDGKKLCVGSSEKISETFRDGF